MKPLDASVRMTEVEYDPFAVSQFVRSFPTTDAQREIWLACELGHEASLAYNESISLVMHGPLNAAVMRAALQALLDRHEALRATFDAEGATMVISRQIDFAMEIVDLAGASQAARDEHLAKLRADAVETPFDLINGPLFRAVLARVADDTHELILTAHHIVCDGWSFGIISRDLMALYKQLLAGQTVSNLQPADSFGDYALSAHEPEQARAYADDERYWVGVFDRGQPVLDLPTDQPRGRQRAFASKRIDYLLQPQLVDAVRKMGAKQGVSLFATLFGVFAALLERLGGDGEVALGVPAAGQSTRGLDALVGHCVNLLPVRVTANRKESVSKLLQHAGSRILDAYDHQNCTFGSLLTKLNVPREANRLPLVSVLFNIDSAISPEMLSLEGLAVSLRSNPRAFENFELFINASQTDAGIVLECQYHSSLFDAETIQRWLALYQCALERAVADPTRALDELFIATPDDLEKLRGFNPPAEPYARDARLEALITQQVTRTPNATAVVGSKGSLTYRELEELSNAVAHALVERGIGSGHLVGMACGRNLHLLPAMLGILKAGAAYVPLDPSFPEDRLAFMCADADIRCVVGDRSTTQTASTSIDVLYADDLAPRTEFVPAAADPLAPAYVIYTSGSTGQPKGVVIHHQAIVNFLTSMAREPGLSALDRLVAVTTTSFDIAVLELFLPLTVGAQTILADRETVLDGPALRSFIEQHKATVLQATPAGWRLLVDAGWTSGDNFKALVGGEALPDDLAQELAKRAGEVWNMYGPTETTVWSTCWALPRSRDGIRIGRPIANTEVLVLDDALKPCPIGVAGEIFIGGDGVATGYWRRPELTAERFVMIDGGRFYRTGDRGRWRNDGTLEHLGRLDFQIKLRGYRIELGEIEAKLIQHEAVERAVVLVREDEPGDVRLVAYVVLTNGASIEAKELRKSLRSDLPEYMLPNHIVNLPAIPLLPNGKIDRRALPRPQVERRVAKVAASPATATELAVLKAMEGVLNVRDLSCDDDFFAAGGHSLLAARLVARLNQLFDRKLPLRTIFENGSARALSAVIDTNNASDGSAATHISAQSTQSHGPLTVMQESIRFMEELYPGRSVYNTPSAHRLRGTFDKTAFNEAFQNLVQRQPILRTYIEAGTNGFQQRVTNIAAIDLPFEDLSSIDAATREVVLMDRMQELIDQPIDIHTAPLFRARLYRLAPDEHVLLFTPHHIIWDGWSFDLLYTEMSELYAAALERRAAILPPLTISYLDFAYWHRDWMESDECQSQLAYWRQRFSAIEPQRALPTDRPRRAGVSANGQTEWVRVDKELTEQLRRLAMDHGASLNMLVLAIYAVLIEQASAGTSTIIGIPVRGRSTVDVEPVMGPFINVLPIHIAATPELQVSDLLGKVKKEFIASFAHQDVPFEKIMTDTEIAKRGSRSGLCQAVFSFQDARERQRRWGPLTHSSILVMQKGAPTDFGLWLMEVPDGLEGAINYNEDLFDAQTVQLFKDRLLGLLRRVAENPAQSISSLVSAPGPDAEAFMAWIASRPVEIAPPAQRKTEPTAVVQQPASSAGLAEIWAQLLGIESADIHPDDNFFDLGGTSLLVMRAVEQSRVRLGLDVEPRRYVSETLRQISTLSPAESATAPKASGAIEGVATIWARLLGIDADHIDPQDNFFDLGGTSILAMQSLTAMEKELGLRIDPRRIVSESIQQLVRLAGESEGAEPVTAAESETASEQTAPLRVAGRMGQG